MRAFANRARTKLAQRVATLITEVARSGGDTQEIMEQVNRNIGELQSIDRERQAQMRPYSVVVYIAFGVFLFTDIMLIRTFFTQIVNMQSSVLQTAGGGGGVFGGIGSVNISLLKTILFHATVIQAIFGGLIAGKMSEGKLGAGLKHTVLLHHADLHQLDRTRRIRMLIPKPGTLHPQPNRCNRALRLQPSKSIP